MKISELHAKLASNGISEEKYFLHGLLGSPDDDEKIALNIRKGKHNIEYETYFKERGEKHSIRIFTSEQEACAYIFNELINEQIYARIAIIDGLSGLTASERLYEIIAIPNSCISLNQYPLETIHRLGPPVCRRCPFQRPRRYAFFV